MLSSVKRDGPVRKQMEKLQRTGAVCSYCKTPGSPFKFRFSRNPDAAFRAALTAKEEHQLR
jgi:hypothetical protein